MVAEGTFTPEDDSARSFTSYFDAEIEVEREMDRPFELDGDGLSRQLTVTLDPALWFTASDGTVTNLTQFDYQSTGELVEFEAEFEKGITEIEFDD